MRTRGKRGKRGKRVVGARRLVQLWLAGWEAFAASAGGRAQDLVGGNPWRTSQDGTIGKVERDRARA